MRTLLKILFVFVGVLLLSIAVRVFVGEPVAISSGSMEPALYSGDWIWINKTSYGAKMPRRWAEIPLVNVFTWSEKLRAADEKNHWKYRRFPALSKPRINDLVVFENPEHKNSLVIKRVERIVHKGSRVVPDSANYAHICKMAATEGNRVPPDSCYTVQQNFYYMMGDNIGNSHDSRVYGYVPESAVIGKVKRVLFSTANRKRFFKRIK